MRMLRIVTALLFCLFLPVTLMAGEGPAKTGLSEGDIQFLDRILTLVPAMSEAELRTRFPYLGIARAPQERGPGLVLDLPEFPLGGLKWRGEFRLRDGKLSGVHLWAMALYPGMRQAESQTAPREEVRAAGLRMAEWFQKRDGMGRQEG